jgi:hypothetical protein
MSLFDLIFLISMVTVLVAAVRAVYLAIRGRLGPARKTVTRLLLFAAVYLLVLVGFSLAEPEIRIPVGGPQCFDEWCITVEQASRQKAIGPTRANGVFYVTTLQVSSRAQGRPQRENDVRVYLSDDHGHQFDVSPLGQQALVRAGLAGMPLTSFVPPGGSFESRLAFDVPADSRPLALVKTSWSWFPFRLIIGGPQSWLHRPTIVPLSPATSR